MSSQSNRRPLNKGVRFALTDLAVALAAFTAAGAVHAQTSAPATEVAAESTAKTSEDSTVLSDMTVTEDPMRVMPNESTGSSIGFTKPLLETPRTVSFVSSEQLSLLGISTADDLTRVVPGTYTTTRYGLQGGINVRGVAADMYFRGMKRINMQGHARTSLAAMDSIEVIKGPPSPIYGMGKIGGYSNLTPKSGRAKVGSYLEETKGFVQAVGGDYRKSEASAGAGGPLSVLGKTGGYYVYGLLEDSDTYTKKVGAEQRLLQGTISLDNIVGPVRLEAGTQVQNSITSGAYMNRVTQDLIDNGNYISGQPLFNLDMGAPSLDGSGVIVGAGDGGIGLREEHYNSMITGSVGSGNRPLNQTFVWPSFTNASGVKEYYPVGQFPTVAGVPAALYNDVYNNPAKYKDNVRNAILLAGDPGNTGKQTAFGPQAGGSGGAFGKQPLPAGYVLDPNTVQTVPVDYRGNGSFEEEQNAKLALFFVDFVYDSNPDFTLKSQFFHDYLDSYKHSYLPYGEKQDIHLWEEKVTLTKRIPDEILPDWLRVNTLASVNYRETSGKIKSSGGDFDYRQDIMFNHNNYYPNTTFWNQLYNDSFETGAPRSTDRKSKFNEMGVGAMLDVDLFRKTNFVVGARIDGSEATATEFSRIDENNTTYNAATAATCKDSVTNGVVTTDREIVNGQCNLARQDAKGWDDGISWSASLSQQLPYGLRPYVTMARSSVALDGANNIMPVATVSAPDGHVGEAELKEGGIKASWFGDKVFLTTAYFEQTRTDISNPADPTAGAEVSSTETTGVEGELKLIPIKNASIQLYAVWMKADYIFNSTSNMELTARQLGFQDIKDAAGNVIYPAEAFLYGGRWQMAIPTDVLPEYKKKQGTPETQYGFNANYNFNNGIGLLFGGTYSSSVYADRLEMLKLPEAFVANAAVSYDTGNWHLKLNGYNIFDELYFRGRNSDTNTNLVSVMPGRRFEVTVKLDF